jgi:hypothetical protein
MPPPATTCRLGSNRDDTRSRNGAQQKQAGRCKHSPDNRTGNGRNICRRPERISISPSSPNCWLERWFLAARGFQFTGASASPPFQIVTASLLRLACQSMTGMPHLQGR